MKGIPEFINEIKKHLRNTTLGKILFISFVSQMVSSLTNFGIVFCLVRLMNKTEFGQYGLGFALMLLISGLVCASIAVQFVVNLPDQPKEYRAAYALHHTAAVGVVSLILIVLAFALQTGTRKYYPHGNATFILILPVTVASGFYTLRDLLMRFAFSERRESLVLASNVVVAIATATIFSIMVILHQRINAPSALYAYSTGQAAGCLHALLVFKLPWRDINVPGLWQAFRDSWTGGRYNILSGVVYNIRTQAHNFVVAPLLGVAALAEVNAARVLVSPALMAIPPVTQILMPRLAEKRALGSAVISKITMLSIAFLLLATIVYSLSLVLNMKWVLPLALGKAYEDVGQLVIAWCVTTVVLALRNCLTVALEVVRAFRNLLVANVATAVGAMFFAVNLARTYGGLGAIYALAMAEALLCVILIFVQIFLRKGEPVSLKERGCRQENL